MPSRITSTNYLILYRELRSTPYIELHKLKSTIKLEVNLSLVEIRVDYEYISSYIKIYVHRYPIFFQIYRNWVKTNKEKIFLTRILQISLRIFFSQTNLTFFMVWGALTWISWVKICFIISFCETFIFLITIQFSSLLLCLPTVTKLFCSQNLVRCYKSLLSHFLSYLETRYRHKTRRFCPW